jgi:peptidoglycan/xylan/chitin deacetylase (PgdA/CDA1 family)
MNCCFLSKSFLVRVLLLAAVFPSLAAASQVIILKLDDIVQHHDARKPVSDRWLKVHEYLVENDIKGSFGVITESLEKDNPTYFQWLKDVQAAGKIELWHHGYKLRGPKDQGEFEQGSACDQRAILARGEQLAQEKLGFTFAAFGPHWSGTTDSTDEALEGVPEIKIWLYGPAKPKAFSRLSIPRVMALENPTFVPDSDKFIATYEKHASSKDVLLLQGHPNQWDDARWEGFVRIIKFLKSKDVVFMTPSGYLATQTKP